MTTIIKQNNNHTATTLNKGVKAVKNSKPSCITNNTTPPISRLLVLSANLKEEKNCFGVVVSHRFVDPGFDPMIQ